MNHEIGRGEVGDDQIEVEIERLFDHLRRDHDFPLSLGRRTVRAEQGHNPFLDILAIPQRFEEVRMAGCCHNDHYASEAGYPDSAAWRRALWLALAVNAAMFAGELIAGLAAGSAALQADALDFMGDTTNYAISLGVVGMAIVWRARAALVKGFSLLLLGLWVLGTALWHAFLGTPPAASVMGAVAILALAANGGVAVMLYRFRRGDANMRSVWICSRNDAIGNLAVLLAAGGVFGTGMSWPDLIVAGIMATLGISGGGQIVRQALAELTAARLPRLPAVVAK